MIKYDKETGELEMPDNRYDVLEEIGFFIAEFLWKYEIENEKIIYPTKMSELMSMIEYCTERGLFELSRKKMKEKRIVDGTWVKSSIPGEDYVCSNCGGAAWYYDCEGYVAKSRYCPNCGAKMKIR